MSACHVTLHLLLFTAEQRMATAAESVRTSLQTQMSTATSGTLSSEELSDSK
jgi:hypothetical protein